MKKKYCTFILEQFLLLQIVLLVFVLVHSPVYIFIKVLLIALTIVINFIVMREKWYAKNISGF